MSQNISLTDLRNTKHTNSLVYIIINYRLRLHGTLVGVDRAPVLQTLKLLPGH